MMPVRCFAWVLAAFTAASLSAQESTRFRIRLENVSGGTVLPGPFAPGVWVVHQDPSPLFEAGAPDRGLGLAAIAEDGNPAALAAALETVESLAGTGVFNTPAGSEGPGPLFPGQAYEFEVEADAANPYLSFASMLVQTNDIFAGPAESGIRLFDESGAPISGEVTQEVEFWDVGSERNEAPGLGVNQAPRQSGPDTGPGEGVVSAFVGNTRALPAPGRIVRVEAMVSAGGLRLRVENISAASGALTTPIAPVFFATHDASWSLFTDGELASAGLEALAEDGGPGGLVGEHQDASGTGAVGAQPITVERPGDDPGPAFPGESYEVVVPVDGAYPYLSIAAMVVESNDVFLAFGSEGLRILDEAGELRGIDELNRDIARLLAIWDAGTEANEVPGAGANQALRQAAPNTGDDDPTPGVRRYDDSTNDLRGGLGGGFASLEVVPLGDLDFEVRFRNTSGDTAFPGVLTPLLWAAHDGSARFFTTGEAASPGIERLAEDGDASMMAGNLETLAGVQASGVMARPDEAEENGPLFPGMGYIVRVTADPTAPRLSLASMVVPSNDLFLAFGPEGLLLLDENGDPRSAEDIAADIEAEFIVWDAGTEANQAGAAGPDQAPRQAAANTGAPEGSGLVRVVDDPVWAYPAVGEVLRVTVAPVGADAPFRRGDGNQDGTVDMSDAMMALMYLFLGADSPGCLDALDANDSGRVNISDPVWTLNFLFRGGPELPQPTGDCGGDGSEDGLGCTSYEAC